MRRRGSGEFIERLRTIWWWLCLPVIMTRGLARFIVRIRAGAALAKRDALPCQGCGEPVSLVSRWECGWCGYVFDGFAFAPCEVCGAVPPFIECQRCGVGIRHPGLF